MSTTLSAVFFLPYHLAVGPQSCLNKLRLDSKIDFQRTFFKKCTTILIDGTGPSIIEKFIISLTPYEIVEN